MAPLNENAAGRKDDVSIGEETAPGRAEREPGHGSDVERESLTSGPPSQKYPGDGDVPGGPEPEEEVEK